MNQMKQIIELIEANRLLEAKSLLENVKHADIAEYLEEEDVGSEIAVIIFRLLPKELAVETFAYLNPQYQRYIIEAITDAEISNIVDKLYMDDTIDFIEEMPANIVKKVLKNTDRETRKIINEFFRYPKDSAGSLMTIEYVDLYQGSTVREALEHIRNTGIDKETINICYIMDKNRTLTGVVSIRKLILNDESKLVDSIMDTDVISVNTLDDQEYVAELFKKYDMISLPVTDAENRLVGIITVDDILDVIEEETTEDMEIMGALSPSDDEYLKTGVFKLAKNRIVWLMVLMISSTITGSIIKRFDDVLQSMVILAAYIPMLMDTGGNAGSQSSTLIIRGLALGEIRIKDAFRVVFKEFRVSLICGVSLAVFNFIKLMLLDRVGVMVALTICISLFFTVIAAKVLGGVLPILAKELKLDPALMASPLITTLVDAFALTIYFIAATALLGL